MSELKQNEKSEESLQDLNGAHIREPTYASWESREEKGEKGAGKLSKELMAENFSNLGRKMDIQIYKVERILNVNSKEVYTEAHYNCKN